MDKSQRAALLVFLSLLATLVAGLVLYFAYAATTRTAVPLLAGCTLVAFGLVIATARLVIRFRRSQRLAETHQVPPRRLLHALTLRQWLILMVGMTVIALGTGALTGVRILAASPTSPAGNGANQPTPTALPQATTASAVAAGPTSATPTYSPSPSDSPGSSLGADPSGSAERPETTGSIKYLDSEPELAGNVYPQAVTFSAHRYQRGVTMYCNSATSTYVQWNVAGYASFDAVGGIDDNTQNAYGAVIELLFYDQDGHQLVAKAVEASVGHSQKITLNLTGVVSLRMTCSGRDAKTNQQRSTTAALGDPKIARG